MTGPYAKGLERNAANYTPLTPVSFLAKAAYVYPDRLAVVHGARAPHLARDLRALPPARLGAAEARREARRHGRGHAAQRARR